MAASALALTPTFCFAKVHHRISPPNRCSFIVNVRQCASKSKSYITCRDSHHLKPLLVTNHSVVSKVRASSDECLNDVDGTERLLLLEDRPINFTFWVLFCASLSLAWFAFSKDANAAADSIKASGFGLNIANALRKLGWPDEFVSPTAPRFLDKLFKNAKEKAGPVEEFQWLGLMLFVAVPFPGTGAWSGAIIASILDMPFWSAVSANFVGVVFAGLLVNLLVNLGLKYAIITGIILFFVSTFMWSFLRSFKKTLKSSN
ncbi:uncharacterized protein LOC114759586 isoform X2 [Neltuma alba]|uniref:uncharacterized protein LOC114759586 isoform X2 n=1 Tax=Neltuma alba TaxID=207710 RepID=UPI0010A2FE56|nr:uncharacterized protein LOC114759586 isoform X2 [Prosopis alba]